MTYTQYYKASLLKLSEEHVIITGLKRFRNLLKSPDYYVAGPELHPDVGFKILIQFTNMTYISIYLLKSCYILANS